MTLQQRVDSDLKEAMRAKDATKLGVLRMLKSALKYAAIAKSGAEAELSDTEAVQVIRKQAKQRQDSIESFEKGGRAELADKEKEELAILNSYLPQGMSPDDLAKIVRETIAELGATSKAQMGAVMKALQAKTGGRADGKALSVEVQKQLTRGKRSTLNAQRSTPNGCILISRLDVGSWALGVSFLRHAKRHHRSRRQQPTHGVR